MKLKKLQVTTRYDVILKFLKLIFKARHQLTYMRAALQQHVETKGLKNTKKFGHILKSSLYLMSVE